MVPMSLASSQVVLGIFVATFAYCLLVLRTIRRADLFHPSRLSLAPGGCGRAARSNPAVLIRMLDAIAQIAGQLQHAQHAACLQ